MLAPKHALGWRCTGGGQNNGNTMKSRNIICLCSFFCLSTHCSALVSALVILLSGNSCERIIKWETCPILKDDIVGVHL
jgi:hypothetical protein